MSIRERYRDTPVTGYYSDRFSSDSRTVQLLEQTTTDYSPSPGGLYFRTSRRTVHGGLINGGPTGGFWNSHWQDFPVLAISGKHFPFVSSATGQPPLATLGAQLLARTNPSKPTVNLPSFVGELVELPQLFKKAGANLLKRAASANLKYQFGWRPLISDLLTFLEFQSAVDKRFQRLKKLQRDGVVKSTIGLWGDSWSSMTPSYPLETNTASIYSDVFEEGYTQIRGHVKWYLQDFDLPETDEEIYNLAKRAVLGLYQSPASYWEVLPWSWFIDWCSNVGNMLNAQRNLISCIPSPCEIMTHTQVVTSSTPPSTSDYSVEGITVVVETKERDVVTPFLHAELPILTGQQLSILGSIGILRR